MTGAESIGSGAAAYYASRAQSVGCSGTSSGTSGSQAAGVEDDSGASTTISPFAQLLSNLQQLQTQNPTSFTQVVSQIASQLQSAAQQATGNQSTVLSNLASQFQNVANTGDLSQLQTHHHHGHHGGGTYGGNGQPTSNGSTSTSSTTSGSGSLQQTLAQLFSDFSVEVDSALGDQSVASTSTGS